MNLRVHESSSEQSSKAARDRQAQVDQISWYHEFDFGGGLHARPRTPDIEDHRRIWRFIEAQLKAIDFRGKTVLEIGAWDGYWSFYAEGHGAKQVLASDDLTQNWSDGGGIRLACELLRSQVEVRQDLSIYELSSLNRRFDIIVCLGVYYHLLDPFYALAQVRHCCHSDSLLLLEGDLGHAPMAPDEVRINYRSDDLAFLPSARAFERMLKSAYFTVASQALMFSDARKKKWYQARRAPFSVDRAFTVCRPFEGVNECHAYLPPFGLKAYDDRFRDA